MGPWPFIWPRALGPSFGGAWALLSSGVARPYYPLVWLALLFPGVGGPIFPRVGQISNCSRLFVKTRMLGLTWTHQKLKNGRIGTLEAPPQLRTTSERSSGLLSVAWMA